MSIKQSTALVVIWLLTAGSLMAAAVNAPLADAVKAMDWDSIRSLLQRSVDVNAAQSDGMTALHWAAYLDNLEIAKMLVRAGANVKAVNRYGVTPLSLACNNGNGPIVELFLDAGADPNTTHRGETVLMTAARTGKLGTVKALLARGADVHAAISQGTPGAGQTALMWAAAEGHADVVEELIKARADFRSPLDNGFTPMLFAAREGRIDVVRTLLKAGADVNASLQPPRSAANRRRGLQPGMSPLLMAIKNGHLELATLLLDAGADANQSALGYTPLHAIVPLRKPGVGDNDPAPEGSGNVSSLEFAKKLVEHGADVNARITKHVNLTNTRLNDIGATPFLLAASTADAELMKALVAFGADPLLTNADNSTALMIAAGLGNRSPGEDAGTESETLEALQVALDLGIDVNAVDKNGETAMHGAAYKNLPEVVTFLAKKGARIELWNTRNKFGWTPTLIAKGYRFGNFKPSDVTLDALYKLFTVAGLPLPLGEKGQTVQIY